VRLFYFRKRYRDPFDFTEEGLADAAGQLDRLWSFRRRLDADPDSPPDAVAIEAFRAAMDDDFNTAEALAALFAAVREGNRLLDAGEDAGPYQAAYDEIVDVLGIGEPGSDLDDLAAALAELAAEVGVATGDDPERMLDALVARRVAAREDRDWATADRLRDDLAAVGIVLEDSAEGTRWHRS
jgi:cysteinyl-tRNA synthetase